MSKLALNGGERHVTEQITTGPWPRLFDADIKAVHEALEKSRENIGYITSYGGQASVGEFEQKFAGVMGAEFAFATNGGGTALHTAMMAAGVKAGDEVIVSPYTWGQTVSCILQQCAIPVFADIDPKTYTLTAASIEEKITPYTRAIVVVHLYGHSADMDPIMELARKHGLKVIEDAAQATGSTYKGRRCGSLGNFGCFSIGDGKQIMGGEGGVLLCHTQRDYELVSLFGMHPARQNTLVQDPELVPYVDSLIYTYRIHPLSATICGSQLDIMDKLNGERAHNHEMLSKGLKDVPGIEPVYVAPDCTHVYHQYSPTFKPEEVEGVSRETYIEALQAEGVAIAGGYVRKPIHLRPRMQDRWSFYGNGYPWKAGARDVTYAPGDCPNAEHRCAHTELSIAGGPAWWGDQSRLVKQFIEAFHKVTENLDELRDYERNEKGNFYEAATA